MQKLTIALIGEGKNDYGGPDGYGVWQEGAAQPFIRKFLFEAEINPIKKQERVSKWFATPNKNIPKFGIYTSALRSFFPKLEEMKDKIDLLIYYQDLDKQDYKKVIQEVENAFAYLNEEFGIPAIAMIPMRMLENWLLADEKAFENLFGSKPAKPRLPSDPEQIWGEEQDPKSNHPKKYLKRVLEQYGEPSITENFILIANASDVETMKKNCPISFIRFAQKMEHFASNWL